MTQSFLFLQGLVVKAGGSISLLHQVNQSRGSLQMKAKDLSQSQPLTQNLIHNQCHMVPCINQSGVGFHKASQRQALLQIRVSLLEICSEMMQILLNHGRVQYVIKALDRGHI